MKKVVYYTKRFGFNFLPKQYFRYKYGRLKTLEKTIEAKVVESRVKYYCKLSETYELPEDATNVKDFSWKGKKSSYYLDIKEFLHYFKGEMKFLYKYGDSITTPGSPTLKKARKISDQNEMAVLFKLNKHRHFQWVQDSIPFDKKKDILVWRGGAYKELRQRFLQRFWDHHLCNVGQTNSSEKNVPWKKEYLSKKEQLQYKFIFCPEGNDVATNLKWVMSSNSLCLMPKPTCETWFMEGTLVPGVHYVEIDDDFSNLEEKILYYTKNPKEAEEIIKNANNYVKGFQNEDLEDLLCIKVLEYYAHLTNQPNPLKF